VYYESAIFKQLMNLLGTQGRTLDIQLKQSSTRLLMIKEKIKSMRAAQAFLQTLLAQVEQAIT
jgi:hypothetical protein